MDLFPETKPPRRAPRKLMHVSDAGNEAIHFTCKHCGHSGWYQWDRKELPVSKAKRGVPCPTCNGGAQ